MIRIGSFKAVLWFSDIERLYSLQSLRFTDEYNIARRPYKGGEQKKHGRVKNDAYLLVFDITYCFYV